MSHGEIPADDLKNAVEKMHACKAALVQSVPINEQYNDESVWRGVVQVFDISGHPTATTAYAWSSPVDGSDNRRIFAVLHIPPIDSPAAAVRAAIVAEHRGLADAAIK